MPLPHDTRISRVGLTVRDRVAVTDFYSTVLGLDVLDEPGNQVLLGAGGREIIRLIGDPMAEERRTSAGLFHLAILLPSRKDLANSLVRLTGNRAALGGASDHGVSEALYLSDPEGNGIELYHDRPRREWPRETDGSLSMGTTALDLNDLIEEADKQVGRRVPDATRLGHVHLHVTGLPDAEAHYTGRVGFDLQQRYGTEAAFMSAGGYHHHVAINTWGPAREPARIGSLGLRWFELLVSEGEAANALLADPAIEKVEDGAPHLRDPSGILMRIAVRHVA